MSIVIQRRSQNVPTLFIVWLKYISANPTWCQLSFWGDISPIVVVNQSPFGEFFAFEFSRSSLAKFGKFSFGSILAAKIHFNLPFLYAMIFNGNMWLICIMKEILIFL